MITEIITITISAVIVWRLYKQSEQLKSELNKSQSQFKSICIKHGQRVEQLLPCSKQFPEGKFLFLGQPIDGIIFGEDSISFIEIKTGHSQLNGNQKRVKKQIEEGRIEFKELRY